MKIFPAAAFCYFRFSILDFRLGASAPLKILKS